MSVLDLLGQHLDPQFQQHLPGEKKPAWHPKQTPGICWHHCPPTKVKQPQLIAYSVEVAEAIGLDANHFDDQELIGWLSGNINLDHFMPYSSCYGGHQFGHWAGQLGDGRAITIGELENNGQRYECQLKGAGPTPYSRTADGRAVLRSSIREFLCSEAMHHLGIPTTRALSLVTTGEEVIRDILYSGHPQAEPGAIVCRVAPSFIRFGHFEILSARQDTELLDTFLNFVIQRDFPDISKLHNTKEQQHAAFFCEVCRRTAVMISHWQRVGFVHGVMNTDNMSILGLTIDYGPYGWLDHFDRHWTPNTTDAQGRRYRFGQQPAIARWNLICLANALSSVIVDVEILKTGIEMYDHTLNQSMYAMQCNKFGLINAPTWHEKNTSIIESGYDLLEANNLDFCLFFQYLINQSDDEITDSQIEIFCYQKASSVKQSIVDWLKSYRALIEMQKMDKTSRHTMMTQTNPSFILRNYLSQVAIEGAEKGNNNELSILMTLLRQPYRVNQDHPNHYAKRPDWALNKVGCSMLSCSS